MAMLEMAGAAVSIQKGAFDQAVTALWGLLLRFPKPPIADAVAVILCEPRFRNGVLAERARRLSQDPEALLGPPGEFESAEGDGAMRAYEMAVDREPDNLKRAFLFYDIAERHPSPAAKAAALLKCALALSGALATAVLPQEKFGLQRALTAIVNKSVEILATFPPERFAMHATACAALYLKSIRSLPTEGDIPGNVVLPDLLENLVVGPGDFPFISATVQDIWCAEQLYRSSAIATEAIFDSEAACLDFARVSEQRLAGIYRGWLGDRLEDFREAREIAIVAGFAAAFSQMEMALSSPIFGVDFDGFATGTMVLPSKDFLINEASGCNIDSGGTIHFLLKRATSPEDAFLAFEDLRDPPLGGVPGCELTLAHSSASLDPFVPMRKSPSKLDRAFLATLMRCIQTLTSMALDVEMSAKAPFRLRKGSLRRLLPGEIQAALAVGPMVRNATL
jgi:hypothetical protein